LYPDLAQDKKPGSRFLKRSTDIVGSLFALAVSSPVLLAVCIIVKLTSKGPILFRQQRVGQHGKPFTFIKFRSMYTGNDQTVHQEYMKSLITGKAASDQGTYK